MRLLISSVVERAPENCPNLKNQLSGEFEMKDLGAAKKILGMEISQRSKR